MELVIMAAGMGSRFGGLKQIEQIGPNGEFIIDYSIYDALKVGFNKIIFIIKEENYQTFKDTIGKRIEPYIPVEYVFQKIDNIPSFVKIPENRVKPWGTAQAIYCVKDTVKEPFVVINADDFYGRDAFISAKNFLDNHLIKTYATVGYEADKTLTSSGAVKRGILKIDENNNLISITESVVVKDDNIIRCTPLNGKKEFIIKPNDLVSMNMLAFDLSIFDYIEEKINIFFKENEGNLDKCEFLIPDILGQANNEKYATVKVLHTKSNWYGVTYKEDVLMVKKAINNLITNNEYPNNLWN